MKRLFRFCGAALLAIPAPALAQAPPAGGRTPYVTVGFGWENKAPGPGVLKITPPSLNPEREYVRLQLPTLILGVGVPIIRHFSLEAVAEWPSTPSEGDIAWTWSYTAPTTHNIASHRDVPVLLLARWEAGCRAGVCFEPVAGAGIAIHRASSVVVSECGSVGVPLPCAPPGPTGYLFDSRPGNANETSVKFAWAFGFDVPIRIANRVWLQPTARVTYIADGYELFAENPRGPNTGSPWVGTLGLMIRVR